MKRWRPEVVLALVGLFLSTRALTPNETGDGSVGDPRIQYGWVLVLAAILYFLSKTSSVESPRVLSPVATFLILGAAVASVVWAYDRGVTSRRLLLLAVTAVFAYFLVSRLSSAEILWSISTVALAVALLSLAAALVEPHATYDHAANGFRGIVVQKNIFGRLMATGLIISLLRLKLRMLSGRGFVLLAVPFVVGLTASRSATAILVAVAAGVIVLVLGRVVVGRRSGFLLAGAAVALPFLMIFSWVTQGGDTVLRLFGKDTTLTNRTLIWRYVEAAISKRPMLGYGYGGFWTGPGGPNELVWQGLSHDVAHAHNGYLDVALQVGWLGLALMMLGLAYVLVLLLSRIFRRHDRASLIAFVLVCFPMLYSVAESNLLNWTSLYCIMTLVGLFASRTEMVVIRDRGEAEWANAQRTALP